MALIPTPSQTVGPFFHYALDHPKWADLTGGGKAKGQVIRVAGRVLDGEGAALPDVMLELWQANAAGKYAHPEDKQDKPVDPAFRGFGRVSTAKDGSYAFTTIRPGAVPGRGNTLQAPHINVSVFGRGLLKRLCTRIYFADLAKENDADPLLASIEDAAARRTLLATPEGGNYRFDIVLQGERETAFLDV